MWLPGRRPRAVLYFHDGQNVFGPSTPSHPTWRADEVAAGLVARGRIVPLAIVAVDHAAGTRRWREYLPYQDPRNPKARVFEADVFADALLERIVPAVREHHPELARVRRVGVGGSSYGAIAALRAALRHPRTFGALLLESPPLWVGEGRLIDDIAAAAGGPWRTWIAVGSAESPHPARSAELIALARRAAVRFRAHGEVKLRVERDARHHETAWSGRLADALVWLFGT